MGEFDAAQAWKTFKTIYERYVSRTPAGNDVVVEAYGMSVQFVIHNKGDTLICVLGRNERGHEAVVLVHPSQFVARMTRLPKGAKDRPKIGFAER